MSCSRPTATTAASAAPSIASMSAGSASDEPAHRVGDRRASGSRPDRRALAEQLLRRDQRREAGRDARDERLVVLLGLLDLLPVGDDLVASLDAARRRTRAGAGARASCARARATSATVNAPASDASTDWIITWKSRSPSSSSSASYAPIGMSPSGASAGSCSIASTTSYASSSTWRRSEWCVCAASHGQPPGPRNRSVSASEPRELRPDADARRCRRTAT